MAGQVGDHLPDDPNKRWESGWKLDHILEQGGNTVMIWARRD